METVLKRLDLYGVALVAFGLVALRDGSRLAGHIAKKSNIDAVGPHGYLTLLGVIMLVLGGILLVRRLPSAGGENLPPVPWADLAVAFGLLVAYAAGVSVIGFTPATFVFLLLASRHLSAGSWLWCGGFALLTTAGFYTAFVSLSDMALPRGILWG
jgi:hypothetical protein